VALSNLHRGLRNEKISQHGNGAKLIEFNHGNETTSKIALMIFPTAILHQLRYSTVAGDQALLRYSKLLPNSWLQMVCCRATCGGGGRKFRLNLPLSEKPPSQLYRLCSIAGFHVTLSSSKIKNYFSFRGLSFIRHKTLHELDAL